MDTTEERQQLIADIKDEFEEILATLPRELHTSILRSYQADDFISPGLLSLVGLPYWLGEKLKVSFDVCRQMAVGNLFLLHTFQSFDFIIDQDRPDVSTRDQIVLGNLCYQYVMRHYRHHFPPDSLFWERTESYWNEWGKSILWEVEEDNQRRTFSKENAVQSSHKAAALKICPTGLAILANQQELIPDYERAIDLMHTTMQLVDDLKDWREDLQHHRYNSLLSLIVTENTQYSPSLSQDDVIDVIYRSDILRTYERIIQECADEATKFITQLGIDPWAQLVNSLPHTATWIIESYDSLMEALGTGNIRMSAQEIK